MNGIMMQDKPRGREKSQEDLGYTRERVTVVT